MTDKTEIFTDARSFVLASAGDPRPAWRADGATNSAPTVYGLSPTEHQFRQAVQEKFFTTKRLKKNDMAEMMLGMLREEEEDGK